MRKGWKETKGDGPNGERRLLEREDGRAFVTVHSGVSYAGYTCGKRNGGYAIERQAQSWCDKIIKYTDKRRSLLKEKAEEMS